MRDVIVAIEAAFRSMDQMSAPERSRMDLPGGVLLQMPAFGGGAAKAMARAGWKLFKPSICC
jgi:hypothetical protein